MKILKFSLSFRLAMSILGMTYTNPKKMKRLNSHLSWLWVWKVLNFELTFSFVMIILIMICVMSNN